jgi:hypothetical protein
MSSDRRIRNLRKQLEAAREGLGKLGAFVDLLQAAPSGARRPSSPSEPGVIELVEVKPGVFATPTPSLCGGVGRGDAFGELGAIAEAFEAYQDLGARARTVGKDAPWRKSRR